VNKWETLILLTFMVVGMLILLATILYAREHAIRDQQLDDSFRWEYNTERVINHYGIPCADYDCECANNVRRD